MAAAKRISQMLCDKERYMNGQLEPVEVTFKVQPAQKPKGRLEAFRNLTLRVEQPGQHVRQLYKNGVKCRDCSKYIKGCATHSEIDHKQDSPGSGQVTKTLEQLMSELVDESSLLTEGQEGHRWYVKGSSFGCNVCWLKILRRSGKSLLQALQAKPCVAGKVQEADLALRARIHPSHALYRRGEWIECQKCLKRSKIQEGRVQTWVSQYCFRSRGQQKRRFRPMSSDS